MMQRKFGLIFVITYAVNSFINCNTSTIDLSRRKDENVTQASSFGDFPKPAAFTNSPLYFNITAQLCHAYPFAVSYKSCQFIQHTMRKNPAHHLLRGVFSQVLSYLFLIHLTVWLQVSLTVHEFTDKIVLQTAAPERREGGRKKQPWTSKIVLIRTDLELRLHIFIAFWNCVFWTPSREQMNFRPISSSAIILWSCYPSSLFQILCQYQHIKHSTLNQLRIPILASYIFKIRGARLSTDHHWMFFLLRSIIN